MDPSNMTCFGYLLVLALLVSSSFGGQVTTEDVFMSSEERRSLRDEARDMFYHGYNAYMDLAFPADELMPLSCKGRVKGREPDRGDIDDVLGNYSLTLIDSLDTLVILDDFDEFERGVKLVIDHVNFDQDVVVSVFEANIRIVGGLVSAHVLSEYLRGRASSSNSTGRRYMSWYKGELLNMALDIGSRLLPAFNTSTGLPHPRINLRHGMKSSKIKSCTETCTACAGSMILEFAALSRLSGESIFEEKASKAMDVLWASRHRTSNLLGNVLNINTGDWVRREAGVGAGIDSYYEYVAKAYVLLGDEKYLTRWNTHYEAIMKYVGQDPLLRDVQMHKPQIGARHFVDSLGAFWPGLQVLMGDVKPAVEIHEILYQVMQRHNFIPEAFTLDFQVHWPLHLLRPEFVESTYFLYRATGNPHYLQVGKQVLKSLQKHARVTCGYATLKDVRTLEKEDRMDSFVLSETFKYLYLLFAEEAVDVPLDMTNFVFTTEAHLLPLSLAKLSNKTSASATLPSSTAFFGGELDKEESCPSIEFLFPDNSDSFVEDLRSPLANLVTDKCPVRRPITLTSRKLRASEFESGNLKHLTLIRQMGMTIVTLPDGRVQLLHTFANAATPEDGEEGLLFMQEMIEMSQNPTGGQSGVQDTSTPKVLSFGGGTKNTVHPKRVNLQAGPAQFGKELSDGAIRAGQVVMSEPLEGCSTAKNGDKFWGKIVVMRRGGCMFVEKARVIERLGAVGGIVLDNVVGSSAVTSPLFAMSGDGTDDISIPMLFLFHEESKVLLNAIDDDPELMVLMEDFADSPLAKNEEDEEDLPDLADPIRSNLERKKAKDQKLSKANYNQDDDVEVTVLQDEMDSLKIETAEFSVEDYQLHVSFGEMTSPSGVVTYEVTAHKKVFTPAGSEVVSVSNKELAEIIDKYEIIREEFESRPEFFNLFINEVSAGGVGGSKKEEKEPTVVYPEEPVFLDLKSNIRWLAERADLARLDSLVSVVSWLNPESELPEDVRKILAECDGSFVEVSETRLTKMLLEFYFSTDPLVSALNRTLSLAADEKTEISRPFSILVDLVNVSTEGDFIFQVFANEVRRLYGGSHISRNNYKTFKESLLLLVKGHDAFYESDLSDVENRLTALIKPVISDLFVKLKKDYRKISKEDKGRNKTEL